MNYLNKQYDLLPSRIKESGKFCCWRYEQRQGKRTKVPYDPETGRRAETNKPETFRDFRTATEAADKYDGIGFLVGAGVCAIDLDGCFDENGNLSLLAGDVAGMFSGCYMEKSPSGKGLRIIFMVSGYEFDKAKYYINNRSIGMEVYVSGATNRFVTLTGHVFREGDVPEMTDALRALLDKYMQRPAQIQKGGTSCKTGSYLSDESVLEKAGAPAHGDKFKKLWNGDVSGYPSQSEAELALCSTLAFFCGGESAQMDRLFRQSGLYRDKWDRQQSGSTYGAITIQKAVDGTTEFYKPGGKRTAASEDFSDSTSLEELSPVDNNRYARNDIGNGNLFADCYRNIARYAPERKTWFIYNGAVWQPDVGSLKTMELCKRLADALMRYALRLKDEQKRNDYIKFVSRWQARRNREVIIKDAAGVYPVMMREFDRNPYLLNCLNGTLDISTREFREHRGADMLTKLSGVLYEHEACCQRWETYIEEVMSGDTDKAAFLQKALGLSLTGDTRFECLFILYGPTSRNGKGCMMETFLRLMGDYGLTARPETLGTKQYSNSGNPSEDVARLVGARFVNISEPDKRLTLNAALVKSLVGNDTINARYLHENSFDFQPMFKLFINCNHLPTVNDLTLFTSDRVKIIPFLRHFEEGERDTGLKERFALPENLSGILNWCLDGYRLLEETGLGTPASVREATDEYEKNSDKISLFIEDCLMAEKNSEARTAEVYAEYKSWCYENGYKPESARNFNASLSRLITIERKRPRGGGGQTTMVTGFRLLCGFDKVAPL